MMRQEHEQYAGDGGDEEVQGGGARCDVRLTEAGIPELLLA